MTKQDNEYAFLRQATGKNGTYNDLYAAYLRGLGFTGTLTDMIGASKMGFTPSKGVGVPVWVPSGAAFFYDFANSLYWRGAITDLDAATDYAGGPGTNDNAAGVWSQFAANVPRITDAGILIEPSRTNSLRNNTSQGAVAGAIGSGGALPSRWSVVVAAGLTTTVIGTGISSGVEYVDVQFSGTPSGNYNMAFDGAGQIAVTTGEVWTESVFLGLVGGSVANIASLRMWQTEYNGGSSVVNRESADLKGDLTVDLTRFSFTTTLASNPITHVQPRLRIQASGTSPIDITLRIGWPQQEKAAAVSSPIRAAVDAPVTRPADALTLILPSGTFDLSFTFDDDSTQVIAGQAGDYAVPTNLNRAEVKSVAGFFP